MSKIKKYLLIAILVIMSVIVCLTGSAKAATIEEIKDLAGNAVSKTVKLRYSIMTSRKDLYCIQHHAGLHGLNTYTVNKYVKITGNTATDESGRKSSSTSNGIMAYIISRGQGYGLQGAYTAGQNALYNQINSWYTNSGSALGINWSYAKNNNVGENQVVREAKEYANSIGNIVDNAQEQAKDNTNKNNIKVVQSNGVIRVGPFNWSFPGNITNLKVVGDGNKEIAFEVSRFVGTQEQKISLNDMVSGQDFYITFRADVGISKITGLSAVSKVSNLNNVYTAEMWFLSSPDQQNLLLTNYGSMPISDVNFNYTYDIPMLGKLAIQKVDEDNQNLVLDNVGFTVQNSSGLYVKKQDNTISYINDKNQATVFITDSQGKIEIDNLIVGEYTFIEVVNTHDEYDISNMKPIKIKVQAGNTASYTKITNRKEYIKLSGYVWLDTTNEKKTVRNDLYKDDEFDKTDELVSGIIVRLKSKSTGEIIKNPLTGEEQVTKTGDNGEYKFDKVIIDKVSDYYVEFEYDGFIYSNVTPYLDKENGSKVSEGSLRKLFDAKFAEITGKEGTQDVVEVKDENGKIQYEVSYDRNLSEAKSTIRKGQSFPIVATTKDANYTIQYQRGSSTNEIQNINLGIYVRAQADLALMQDMDQIKVGINGYEHIYKYSSRFNEDGGPSEDSWNIGVKFRGEYGQMTYSRAIYKADAEYDNGPDESKLHVSVTYKIGVKNESTITSKANSIVNYFDNRYELIAVGTGVNEDGNITDKLSTSSVVAEGNSYKKVEINTNTVLKPSEVKYIYIQFSLSRENVLNLLNKNAERPNLENISEIKSYTSYYDENANKLYGALDVDSVPENAMPGDKTTYEDDTDSAPVVQLVIANARQISGTIFEDKADEKTLNDKNIRQGDGKYDESNESQVGGVTVQLVHVNEAGEATDELVEVYDEREGSDGKEIGWTGAKCETTSDSNGNYTISGYIPGKYAIKYIWGDGTYKIVNGNQEALEDVVENYKGTAIDKSRYDQESTNKQFYKDNEQIRQSHAIDNYEIRKEIDKQLNEDGYNYNTEVTTREMTSTTPQMEFMIEYTDSDIDNITFDRITKHVAFEVNNIDFGIIRRPVQSVNFVKSLSKIRITLANGQILADAEIDENGNMTGQTNYLTYVGPIKENGITVTNGFLKAELDSELIQGATVQMQYKLRTENTSEADYTSEGFYKYGEGWYNLMNDGETQKENDIITITPSKIVDYLDEKSIYKVEDEVNEKYKWKQMSLEDLKSSGLVVSNVTDALENGKYTDEDGNEEEIKPSQIYTTDYLNTAKLKPVRTVNNQKRNAEGGDVYMVVDKVLASAEDANFENQAELVLLDKPGGSKPTPTPGNYIPNSNNQETDDSTSVETIITPSTGADQNFVVPITVGVIALVILGIGVVLIKKKVVEK